MRTFIAIDIPAPIESKLESLVSRLKTNTPDEAVRWVRPQSIHLTLKFLGEVKPDFIGQIERVVKPLAAGTGKLNFEVGGFGVFPNRKRPRVLWVGVHNDLEAIVELRNALEHRFEEFGFEADRRRFTPHLTLGRVKRGTSKSGLERLAKALSSIDVGVLGEMQVSEIVLFESQLSPRGANYRPLQTFELSG